MKASGKMIKSMAKVRYKKSLFTTYLLILILHDDSKR